MAAKTTADYLPFGRYLPLGRQRVNQGFLWRPIRGVAWRRRGAFFGGP